MVAAGLWKRDDIDLMEASALQRGIWSTQRHQQQSHLECGLQHEKRVGDSGIACTEGEPLIKEAAVTQTREEDDLPGTSFAEGVWIRQH